jgi:hypothetical protein
VARQEHRLPISEHDPDLHRATLEVRSILKESPRDNKVTFLFANSRDVQWDNSPKLKEGQEGVWILHVNEKDGLRIADLTAFDPRDVQPPSQEERIRKLLGSRDDEPRPTYSRRAS